MPTKPPTVIETVAGVLFIGSLLLFFYLLYVAE